ncbi:VirK/YbjX family protein [Candidatus Pantoea persica]|uniref:VirK/YbjX family protein n=1 Tax=Candidatus Pantoea persica TaxID=2518128 RepID=UPI00215DC0A2|nr:VirK/YbjX family protein [Candidatus Pantoea persica]MBA2817833.1 virulence factor VirK [Candidatus Pantoea persica]
MSIIISPVPAIASSASLFFQLISGKYIPNKLWLSKSFRLKFVLRTLAFPVTTLRYLNQLSHLPDIRQLMSVQGLLPVKPHRPYLRAGISVAARAQAILDHYHLIASLPNGTLRQLLQSPGDNLLATLQGKNGERFSLFSCPGRFDREGEVTLVLRYQDDVIASLSFSLINEEGRRTLLIGGLQGPRKHVSNEVIREATKAAHGLFPKRLVMEVVFMLVQQCAVEKIVAVGDSTHVFRSLRYRYSKSEYFFASYSEFWASLGGVAREDRLFQLPFSMPRKPLEAIASKKRAEYRRRYELLDALAQQVLTAVGQRSEDQAAA